MIVGPWAHFVFIFYCIYTIAYFLFVSFSFLFFFFYLFIYFFLFICYLSFDLGSTNFKPKIQHPNSPLPTPHASYQSHPLPHQLLHAWSNPPISASSLTPTPISHPTHPYSFWPSLKLLSHSIAPYKNPEKKSHKRRLTIKNSLSKKSPSPSQIKNKDKT